MSVTVTSLAGADAAAALPALAALRMTVFAEWPYLYSGEMAYEETYLREFMAEPDSVLVVARDGMRIVGAATASPMAAQKSEFRSPFEARGLDAAELFYFGESVLLPEYRGQGIGHAFFDHREAQARAHGARGATFAAVIRPSDHPDRPTGYVTLDRFWHKRGYAPVEGLVTQFEWKDHRDSQATAKAMQYWMRQL